MSYKKPNEIKNEVALLDYAIINGYKIEKTKSTVKWAHLKNDATGDKILVNTNKNMYFSKIDENDRGDVLQFRANRLNGGVFIDKSNETFFQALKDLNKHLNIEMSDIHKDLLNEKNKFVEKKVKLYAIQDKEWNHVTIKDTSFLTDTRMIDKSTLEHPIFEGRLFNTYFKLKNDHLITNTGFGKFIDNELVGMEVRNKTVKNILGNHDGIFITNTKDMERIDLVFYSESAIDAISYFELLQKHEGFDSKGNNFCFISFAGNLYDSKIATIINDLDKLPIHEKTKFISITDNDLDKTEDKKEGKKYDVLMTAALLNKFNFPVELSYEGDIYFKLKFDDNLVNQDKLKELIILQNDFVDKNITEKERFGNYLILKETEGKKELHFPKKLTLEDSKFNSFLSIINKKNLYIPHKSKNKDWNDDLKEIKEKKKALTQSATKNNQEEPKIKKHSHRI